MHEKVRAVLLGRLFIWRCPNVSYLGNGVVDRISSYAGH
jgi:hypothetical protein